MNVLILNGSPRRNGIVGSLLKEAEQSACGHVVERIDLYDCQIVSCSGCMACRTSGRCSLPEDDGHRLAERITTADLLVVGTPTYWGNMSAKLKCLFDRIVPVFMGENRMGIPQPRRKGCRAIVVTTCTTPWPFNILFRQSSGAAKRVKEVLRTAGYRMRSLQVGGTKPMHGQAPEQAIRKMRRLVKKSLKKETNNG